MTRLFRTTVLALGAILLPLLGIGLLAWKGGDHPPTSGSEAAASPRAISWAQVHDDPTSRLRITAITDMRNLAPEPYGLRLLAEVFSVTYDLSSIDALAYARKKALMMAAGQIPDVFTEWPSSLPTSVKQGFIIPVPLALIAEQAPTYARMVNRYAPYAWRAGMVDGENYAIPLLWMGSRFPRVGLWRMDLLRRAGVAQVPTTIAEYEDAFHRLQSHDEADGGRRVYGMGGDLSNWFSSFTEIFGAHGVMPYDWSMRDGGVVWGGIQPEAREALAVLQRWYRLGYIHPDFATDHWADEGKAKFIDGTVAYHNYLCSFDMLDPGQEDSLINTVRRLDPAADLAPAIVPTGPRGERGHRIWGINHGFLVFGKPVAQRPEIVLRMLRMIETLMCDEQLYIRSALGEEGVHWRFGVGGAGAVGIAPYDSRKVRSQQALAQLDGIANHPLLPAVLDPASAERYTAPAVTAFRRTYTNPDIGRQDLFGNPQPLPDIAPLVGRLIALQQTRYAQFITGARSLDAFGDFVGEWMRSGGDVVLARMQTYYREMQQVSTQMRDRVGQ